MKRVFIMAAIVLNTQLVLSAPSLALDDPDWGVEIQNNTQCSFINSGSVNVRSGPGTDYPVVVQLNAGDMVRAVYQEGGWVKLAARVYRDVPNDHFEPLDGWVSNQYINGCSEPKFDQWRQ
jgi:SH3-like domain-containing protein